MPAAVLCEGLQGKQRSCVHQIFEISRGNQLQGATPAGVYRLRMS